MKRSREQILVRRRVIGILFFLSNAVAVDSYSLSPGTPLVEQESAKGRRPEIKERFQKFDRILEEFLDYLSKRGRFDGGGSFQERKEHFFLRHMQHTETGVYAAQTLDVLDWLGDRVDLRPGMKVLDLGSGQGVAAVYLAAIYGVKVTGIEFDETLCQESRFFLDLAQRAGIIQKGEVELIQGDFLDYSWGEFDAIHYFAAGTYHFEGIPQKLQEELKEGGVFIFTGYAPQGWNERMLLAGLERKGFELELADRITLVRRTGEGTRWREEVAFQQAI